MIEITNRIQLADDEIEITYVLSSGPGGQNVNKVATAAQLRFDVTSSGSLPEEVKQRLQNIAGSRLSNSGILHIKAQRYRSQERNRQDAINRLASLIRTAATRPSVRRPTTPSRAAIERRLNAKRRRSHSKQSRGITSEGD